MAERIPQRADVPAEHKWRLEDIYPTDEAWEQDWQKAKASADVKAGDRIEIEFGNKSVAVEVTQIMESTKKDDAKEMFRYL